MADHRGAAFEKNGRIELLRFVFAVCILMFHTTYWQLQRAGFYINEDWCIFRRYVVAVEAFFIISGYLLAAKLDREKDRPSDHYGQDAFSYLIKKLRQVLPDHVIAMIGVFTVFGSIYHRGADFIVFLKEGWASIFLLQPAGFTTNGINTPVWYLATWLIVSFIYYYLGRKYHNGFVNVWCPIIALFGYGYIAHVSGSLTNIDDWLGLGYKYMLRGFAGMALGITAYVIAERVKESGILAKRTAAITFNIIEAACLILVFRQICSNNEARYDFAAVFFVFVAFVIMVSKPNEGRLNNKAVYYLGSITLPLYLNQMWAIMLGSNIGIWLKLGNGATIAIICLIAFAAAMLITEGKAKAAGWLKKRAAEKAGS